MFYVIVIDDEAKPQQLFGPETWDECVARIQDILRHQKTVLTIQEDTIITEEGAYDYPEGGGIYIIQAEA